MWSIALATAGVCCVIVGLVCLRVYQHRQAVLAANRDPSELSAIRERLAGLIVRLIKVHQYEVVERLNKLWEERAPAFEGVSTDRLKFNHLMTGIEQVLDDTTSLSLASHAQRRTYMLDLIMTFEKQRSDDDRLLEVSEKEVTAAPGRPARRTETSR